MRMYIRFNHFFLLLAFFSLSFFVSAASKKIEVMNGGAQYHDVVTGDTLGQICRQYFSASKQQKMCLNQVVADNPEAFINNSANRLIAGKRLWLPGSARSFSTIDKKKYRVKNYSWGQIKTPK